MTKKRFIKNFLLATLLSLNLSGENSFSEKKGESHFSQETKTINNVEFSLRGSYFGGEERKNVLESMVGDDFSFYFNQKLSRRFVEDAHVYFYKERDFEDYAGNFQRAFVYATTEVLEKHPTYIYFKEMGEDALYFLNSEVLLPMKRIALSPINALIRNNRNKNEQDKENFVIDLNTDSKSLFEGVEDNRNYKTEIIFGSSPALRFRYGPNFSTKINYKSSKLSYEQALTKDTFLEAGAKFDYAYMEKPSLFLFIEKTTPLSKLRALNWRLGVQQEYVPEREEYDFSAGFSLDFKY